MSEQPQPQRMQQTMPEDGGGWHHVNAGPHLHIMFHPNRQLLGREPDNIERPSGTNLTVLETPYDNRILSCLVVSPPGRPISKFDSVKQFLEACRDFIKAHRSLLDEGRILHRDISENNVIITDAGGEGDPRGMLIDLTAQ